ncbi:glycosyltransferase [Actinophytocola algeriensis]|uniref:Vancomycin aglycone glucosyltransferase n=1 Tax=Actinophytocola algeriensis TaxID=1768010 RepID=A0A7W7VD18_9PSEU|nr:glycosyltransferase [Actinophytocola algeriensis]MBB4905758.1 vancomycin aglycone glucosyltransferase [Actinophytocola algeriensis]MBE1472557.1 vancomycin aglycone glucosyltransferase [Actinophytocola algeriensis]
MRALLSTTGSRGDVQPLLALAVRLRELGHEARLSAPPDFAELAAAHAVPFVPVGPRVRSGATGDPKDAVADMVAGQFATLRAAAAGCDVLVGCNQLQVAAHSVAELLGLRYVFADYSPIAFPSAHHLPPRLPGPRPEPGADPRTVWAQEAARRNAVFGPALNDQRTAAGLAPVTDVLAHILTDRPLLAADPALAPWPAPADLDVTQTGAWLLPDERPLPPEVTDFLADGEAPVYFGFGSTHTPRSTGAAVVEAARALGRRAIVLRGWADLDLAAAPDCLAITEANFGALFPRVAAVVHHGGAGTTTAAALAGVPQVVVPHRYDQYYFADRVQALGIGAAGDESLTGALERALGAAAAAKAFEVRTDGVRIAARYVLG